MYVGCAEDGLSGKGLSGGGDIYVRRVVLLSWKHCRMECLSLCLIMSAQKTL